VTYDLLPQTNEQRRTAMLAFAGILGGGLIAYEAGRSLREGDLFKTDPVPPNPEAGAVALLGGMSMLALMVREAVKEAGWKPLLAGVIVSQIKKRTDLFE
jgi:hypothetical protein